MSKRPTVNLRGSKKVDGEIIPDSYVIGPHSLKENFVVQRTNMNPNPFQSWKHALLNPLIDNYPGILSLILVGLQIFLFCFIAGLIIVLAADKVASDINSVPQPPSLPVPPPTLLSSAMGSVIMAFVSFAILYGIGWMTREKHLPAYILPEQFWTMIVTGKFGFITATVCSGIGFLGYMVAGFTLRSLVNGNSPNIGLLQPVTNVATGNLSYLFYWIGGTVINFAWLWCTQFKNDRYETDENLYGRGLLVTSVLTFAFVLAFYGPSPGHGLVVFSPGLYLTGLIYNNFPMRTFSGDQNTPWAIFIFVGLWLVPATAAFLYIIFNWLVSYKVQGFAKSNEDYGMAPGVVDETPSAPPTETGKYISKNIVVNY